MKTIFEYLIDQENQKPGFMFDRTSDRGLVISYPGYNHMYLAEIRETLMKTYKAKLDFEKGYDKFDNVSGRTFCYFKNVYKECA